MVKWRLFMNVKVLETLEKGWIKEDWKVLLNRSEITVFVYESIIECIDSFKSNRRVKEIALIKYKKLPIYITAVRKDWPAVLDWVQEKMISLERYEDCKRIQNIKVTLYEQSRRNTKVVGNTTKSKRRTKPSSSGEVGDL